MFILNSFNFAVAFTETSNSSVNLRCTGGSWGSGAETIETLPAATEGEQKFTAQSTDHTGGANYVMCGFSRETDSSASGFGGIRYANYLRITEFRVYESGGQKYSGTFFTNGDIFSVHRSVSGVITYRLNGTVIYTSATSDTSELKGDFGFFNVNDRALNIIWNRGFGDFNPFYDNLVNMTNY